MDRPAAAAEQATRRGFHFTARMRAVCADMVARLPDLAHIDLGRVAICFAQARKAVDHGMQASLTPLRFAGGSLVTQRRGRPFTLQRVYDPAGREYLYILRFYLPRFLDRPLLDKLTTTVHELWHISPAFDGDLRRHPGRCFAHSLSRADYDRQMEHLARSWLAQRPPEEVYGFLQLGFRDLQLRHGPIYGSRIAQPKLIPVREATA